MLHKTKDSIYVSPLLSSIGGLRHGFTTRIVGDMRDNDTIKHFLGTDQFVCAEQIHGTTVRFIDKGMTDRTMYGADGLVSIGDGKNIFLTVRTADCVPIIAIDPEPQILGSAHSGWKGTLGNIAKTLIDEMVSHGAHTDSIRVVLGPSIGPCCYTVLPDRAKLFRDTFGEYTVIEHDGQMYLNLQAAIIGQLHALGITKGHIDTAGLCTASLHPEFFSYRKDRKETFGEMVGFIGFEN